MKPWPKYPVIYEINAFAWLHCLSVKYNEVLTFESVPFEEWDLLGSLGVDAVWFMGVWERSPAGIQVVRKNEALMSEFRKVLPDFQDEDLIGSAYCIRNYVVDKGLGGTEGFAYARKMLASRDIRLILDFVPNHVAPDHKWAFEHPEYFIRGSEDDLKNDSSSFIRAGQNVIALGRDPYFPAWPDVLQLNAFNKGLQNAVKETVSIIASQCDGIRCDMAMLMMNKIFERTWGARAGEKPASDYWERLIPAIKIQNPDFKFIAESYWDLEWDLQQQGFDFCYDKSLYDRMEHNNTENVRQHLLGEMSYQDKMIRFLENHDEPRAASIFNSQKEKMAAVIVSTLPGAKLLHEGQFEGFKTRVPVFLGRRPVEQPDTDLLGFYYKLLKKVENDVFRNGCWRLCKLSGWPDNCSFQNILAYCWQNDCDRYLIIVNFSDHLSQAILKLQWEDLPGKNWFLYDVLSADPYERNGSEMMEKGLFVELKPWNCHFFKIEQN